VQTEIELETGQSFAIAGLLDNRVIDSLSKIPGLGDIPLLGKLFQSRSRTKNNTELLIVVTPEVVRPIPAGQPIPGVKLPVEFLSGTSTSAPRTPGMEVTGPVPVKPPQETVRIEELQPKAGQTGAAAAPGVQYIPVMSVPAQAAPRTPPATPPPQSQP
jgi:pilus assembly protein CpaC